MPRFIYAYDKERFLQIIEEAKKQYKDLKEELEPIINGPQPTSKCGKRVWNDMVNTYRITLYTLSDVAYVDDASEHMWDAFQERRKTTLIKAEYDTLYSLFTSR